MELKERLKRALQHSRRFTDKVLGEITRAEDWVRRPNASTNHAMWIAGHLGLATNSFIGFVDATKKDCREDLAPLFGKGSRPLDDLRAYPTPADVTSFLTERGRVFMGLLDRCADDDFTRQVTQGPSFMYDVGAVFQMAAWHETLHAGQLTVIHRMIGKTPIADR